MPGRIRLPEPIERRIKRWRLGRLMQRDWDERARENARHYVANSRLDWTDEEFFRTGEEAIASDILSDPINIYQGKDPSAMRVLEIGCGAGRLTRALAKTFGEVHAVDVSGEMVARARDAVAAFQNAHVYKNNGYDLGVIPRLPFDFAYSTVVFQHIPSYEVIENYVREVHRLLRPGALFKFQVQGWVDIDTHAEDTWHGVGFSPERAQEMAERCGFECRHHYGAGQQYFWLWFFKRT
jgi:SAM-dependent methyltransferase